MDLLYVRHPNPRLHKNQLELLNSMAEPERSEHARLLRFGNATMHYYHQDAKPTEEDYKDWLSGLDDGFRSIMAKRGFEDCKSVIGLQRHTLERRDIGMTEFMRGILNEDDFNDWQENGK